VTLVDAELNLFLRVVEFRSELLGMKLADDLLEPLGHLETGRPFVPSNLDFHRAFGADDDFEFALFHI